MKTKFKLSNRILSIVLALVLMVGMLPTTSFTASAAETEYDGVIGELYYKVDKENNVTTIFGNGALSSVSSLANVMTSNVVIEEGVTSIGNTAFRGLSSLEKLTVKGDVTIGNYAFQGCASLETITFMGNVTSVGRNAFYGCASLTNINYYGTTEPSYTNTLSYITLYSFNGVSFCGLIPSNSPATEVSEWKRNMVAYSDGVTQYFTYNNYLYQVKYTNLKTVSEVGLSRDTYGCVLFYITSSTHINLYTSDDFERMITTDMFPQTPGSVLNCYSSYSPVVTDINKPVVVITCIAVNDPTWSWTDISSATATFTAKDADVFTKANATISSETVSQAVNCQTKEQIQYTATVTFNGQTYTDTKTVDGDVGPHSYIYSSSGNTVTESCANCSNHTATATLNADGAYIYTGSAITPATITYSDNWQGDEPTEISYVNNVDVGTATATITVEGQTLTKDFQIKNAYSVSFNANGGSGEKNSVPVMDGEEYTLPANPFMAPSGYQFKGWATSQNGNVLQDEKIIVSENVTLYAIWEKIPAEMPTVAVSENLTLTYGEYTGQKFTATVEKKDGYTYKYQWIDGNTVISNTDTLEIPDDLAAGVYDYYLAVGAKRTDNGEITWYTNRNLLVKVNPKELDASNITLNQDTFTYDGKEQIPTVTVKVGGKTLTENTDYTVTWPSDCKNAGTKTIKVFFRGNYSGSAQVDYEIKQKEIGISWGAPEFIPYTGELIVPQATATGLADGDVCTLTTSVVETTEGAGIVPGRWHAKVTSLSNDNYCLPASGNLVELEYGIVKGYIAAPVVSGIDETIKGKADGKINGLTTEMEYATEYTADDDKYTKVTDANMTFAPGTYYIRYQAAGYYNASSFTTVVIKEGGLLRVTIPQTQTGYTIATEDTELVWNGSTTLSFTLKEGYSKTGAFAVKVNETPIALDANDQYVITNAQEDIEITVEGVADITPPTAEIKVKENKWTSFWNNLTFGLFFKETQDVTITVDDTGSGVKSIQYYLSNGELELDEVKAISDWVDYNGTFKINPDNRYVIYVKVTDNAGNVEYINSEGIVLDATAPVLYGIENGGVYHGDKVFKATDDYLKILKVDGVDVIAELNGDNEYKIIADNAEHTVTAIDEAGNVTEYKITVYKRYMVTYTDGEGSSYEKEFNYGEVITIPTNEIFNDTFRRGGYTLTGWQGYTEGMTMPLSPVTLTALYKPKQYTVSFNANGGETIEPITVTFDEKYGNLPSSAIAGLSGGNKNWYLIDAYGNVTETNIKNLTLVTTARDHTLFIKRNVLAPNISITLAVPGGISDGYQYYIPGASQRVLTATVGNTNTDILDYAYKWYKDGVLIEGATSNVLTLDGNVSDSGTYKVEITATLKDGTNIVVASDTATASKEQKVKILHAANTISYDANGGEEGPQSSYTGGATLNVSKDVPTRMYYDFIGWNTKPDGNGDSYKADELYTFAEDNGNGGCVVTLYAQWKLVEYTVTYKADGETVSTETVGHGKDATLPTVPAKEGFVGKWDAEGKNITNDTTISVVYTAIPAVKPDEVKPEDKTDLEDTKKQLEDMLKDDSYTDEDKKNIQDAIDDIDDALEVIGNVEAVEDLIDKLPENITKNDEDVIKAADDAYNALSDYEKSLVDEDAKKALDDAKATLAELNKPADTDSPQTGDNSNMFLWIALLFISGGAVITLTVVDRKRRMASKR